MSWTKCNDQVSRTCNSVAFIFMSAANTSEYIAEQPTLEETSKDHLLQPFMGEGARDYHLCFMSNHILKSSSDRDSTTSLGRWFQLNVCSYCKTCLSFVKVI